MLGDSSPRTSKTFASTVGVAAASLLVIASLTGYGVQSVRYQNVVRQSSSPIGSQLTFQRSSASITLADLYTDTDQSVLIARFSVENADSEKLPFRGSDYKVYIASDSLGKNVEKMDILFGKLSTDGDMFLVIPKPSRSVYSIFIKNTKYLATQSTTDSDSNVVDITPTSPADSSDSSDDTRSLTKSLSSYRYNPAAESKGYVVQSDSSDVIGFRMTLDPGIKDAAHSPKVLDAKLLNDSSFDFKAFFDAVFKKSAKDELSNEHDKLIAQEKQLEQTRSEYRDRLAANPADTDAAAGLKDVQSQIDKIEQKKSDIAMQLNAYTALTYSDSMFQNLQTEAKVFRKN